MTKDTNSDHASKDKPIDNFMGIAEVQRVVEVKTYLKAFLFLRPNIHIHKISLFGLLENSHFTQHLFIVDWKPDKALTSTKTSEWCFQILNTFSLNLTRKDGRMLSCSTIASFTFVCRDRLAMYIGSVTVQFSYWSNKSPNTTYHVVLPYNLES